MENITKDIWLKTHIHCLKNPLKYFLVTLHIYVTYILLNIDISFGCFRRWLSEDPKVYNRINELRWWIGNSVSLAFYRSHLPLGITPHNHSGRRLPSSQLIKIMNLEQRLALYKSQTLTTFHKGIVSLNEFDIKLTIK